MITPNNRSGDETTIDAQAATPTSESKETISKEPLTDPESGKQFSQKNALLVGGAIVAGAASLGGVAYAKGAFDTGSTPPVNPAPHSPNDPASPSPESTNETDNDAEVFDPHTAPMASGVNDEMSFGEAFAAARAETGPGGVFHWHGQNYHTFVAGEIDQYGHPVVDYVTVPPHELPPAEPMTPGEDVQDPPEVAEGGDNGGTYPDPTPPVDDPPLTETDEQPNIMGMDTDSDGTVDVAFVDINHDGEADAAVTDANQDGTVTEDEIHYINDPESLTEAEIPANPGQMTVDLDGNGTPDLLLVDEDGNQIANLAMADVNQDGEITEDEIAVLEPVGEDDVLDDQQVATGDYDGETTDDIPDDVTPTDPSADMAALDDGFNDDAWA